MKKLKYLVIVMFTIIFVSGCGSNEKTLTCTNTEEANGLKMDQTITMTFKDEKISYVKMTLDNEATSDLIKGYWNTFASTLEGQFTVDSDTKGIKLTTKNDEDAYKYSVSIEVDLKEADKDSLAKYGMEDIVDSDESYEDVKKSAEEDGFTCK